MRRFALVALLALSSVAAARPTDPVPDVKRWQLANGLTVLFAPEHKAPVVTVQIFYHVGGKDEPADKRGIAHLFEHMMFKGSRHVRPEMHARFIDAVGGTNNAFTTDDVTGYHNSVPPDALEFTLKLEAERMRDLELTQKTINSEREVVKEELRLRLENNPVFQGMDKLLHLAYTVHPYRQSPIGEKKMLDTVTVEDCRTFYDTYYRPNNATLVIVGDTDEATVRRLIEQYFGPLERGPAIERHIAAEPEQTEMRQATLHLPVRLPVIVGGYHIPRGDSSDLYALEVLQQILSSGESSRLYQRLVRKDKSAVAAGGFVFDHEDPGLFLTYAAYLPTSPVESVKHALAEEVARVAREPVGAAELEKAKHQLAAHAVFRQERVGEVATQMGVDGAVAHDPMRGFTAAARYDAVTAADVQRVARTYLVDRNFSQVTLAPRGAK
jgi:zinc protease